MLEKTLESPLDCKEIQPVHSNGDQSWVFIGRSDVEAETPILCPPDVKSWLIGKDPDAGKDWGQEEKGTTEDEMVGWHHLLDGHGFGWTPGVGDGQGGLLCCSSWGRKVRHDWATELNWIMIILSLQMFISLTVSFSALFFVHGSDPYLTFTYLPIYWFSPNTVFWSFMKAGYLAALYKDLSQLPRIVPSTSWL